MKVDLTVHIERYIAHPFWPEMSQLVQIQKESGMNRAKSSANRRKALEEHLKSIEVSLGEYEELERLAARPFYTSDGVIIIPKHSVEGFLVSTMDQIRSAGRACPPEMVRTLLKASEWITTKTEPDGVWERFAVVTSGTGAKLSNQRALRSNPYIEDFSATGHLDLDPDFVKPDVLQKAIEWGGQRVGIGASRKMGLGRFRLTRFEA